MPFLTSHSYSGGPASSFDLGVGKNSCECCFTPSPPKKKKRTGTRACASFRQRQTSKLTSNENCCSHVQVLDSSRRSYVFFFFITCLGGLVQALVGVSICPCCFLASFVFQLSPSIILRIRLFFLHTHTHTHTLSLADLERFAH